jgi:hypothetical protein
VPLAAPARVLETRAGLPTADGLFAGIGSRSAGSVLELPVAGRVGVPGDASSVVLNVTVTEAAGAGYATVYPCGSEVPTASNLNFVAGQTVPNAVIAKVGAGGKVCLYVSQGAHLIADVTGYFTAASAGGSSTRVSSLGFTAGVEPTEEHPMAPWFCELSSGAAV